MSFVHLHLHSEYSLLSSTCRIPKIMEKATEMGMNAVACTDNGAVYDVFKFFIAAKDAGVKPIIGVDFYKAANTRHDRPENNPDQDRVVAIAKNLNGYKNLLKLVTAGYLEGMHHKPRIDFEVLEQYKDDLIILSGSLNGEISQLILKNNVEKARAVVRKYMELFEGNFYLELQRHEGLNDQEVVNRELLKISKEFGVPVVATNDVHYLNQEDAYAQEVLLCIQTSRAIFEKNRPMSMIDHPDYHFRSAEEMKTLFADIPEAIENTVKIADQIDLELEYGKMLLPHYDIPEGMTPAQYLREMVYSMKPERMKGWPDDVVDKRIDYELSVISDKGYDNYFLITQDFVNWAKNNGIAVGPGRGSAAGALISYILRITEINPLEYKLPFERFLNPGRPSPPDIDIDFADVRRDEVLNYVTQKYGADKVAQMITFGSMEPKMAVRDVARALGMSYSQGDRIAKMIPQGKQGGHVTIDQALEESPALKQAYVNEEDVKQVIEITRKVEKLPRHSSVHASGVIIAKDPLTEYVAVQRDEKAGRTITQFDMYCLDLNAVSENKAVGLLKFDFLGLRNLTIIENALTFIKEKHGKIIKISEVPLDDKNAYALMGRGETIGVFQLESPGMRRLAKDLQPEQMSDVTAMVALYRPGPMDLIPTFIKGKKNPRTIRYLHPDLESIMGETYGVLVYQEQVMEIANKLAGYDMGRADNLRRAMGKKKKSVMEKEKALFIEGCVQHGYPKSMADELFEFILKFAAYGFNKPHSACYALIAYWTAYLKANYPVEFMTALLNAEQHGAAGPMKEQKMAQAIEECKRMGIKVLPPDINMSQKDFAIEGENIRFGLTGIKNVGASAIESIIKAREESRFIGFTDFLRRVDLRKVNKKTVESLVKASAFDEFSNKRTLLENYPQLAKEISANKEHSDKGQFGLFFDDQEEVKKKDDFEQIPEYPEVELIQMEKEVLGHLITKNPLDRFREIIDQKVKKKIAELSDEDKNQILILAGVVNSVKVVKTKKDNSDMAFLNISDDSGSVEVTVFPKTYKKLQRMLAPQKILLFKGKVSHRNDMLSVLMENAVDLDMAMMHS